MIATITSKLRSFFRREFFDPDVLRALLVTVGLVVPLVVARMVGLPILGSFAAITAQLLLTARIQTTYQQKALILFLFLICISLAPLVGTLAGGHFWLAVGCMAVMAGASSLAKELGAYGQTLSLCGVILFLLSLTGPHDFTNGWYRLLAVWSGGLWAAFLHLFFWPFRPDLPYYTNLALPWEVSGNLAALLANPPAVDAELEERSQKKEVALRNAINNVLPFLRKKSRRYFYIRRDLLKLVRASSRFGATLLAMFTNLENLRQQHQGKFFLSELEACFHGASAAAKEVANALILGRRKDIIRLQYRINKLGQAVAHLQQHLDAAELTINVRLDLHRLLILFDSATQYLQDAQLLLNRVLKKKELSQEKPPAYRSTQRSKLFFIGQLLRFRKISLKHTWRIILLTALSIALYYGFQIPRGYWIALTVMVVLQPDYGTTQQKALQRVIGTAIGAITSTLLLWHPFPPEFFILAVALCCFLFIYLLERNYTIAVFFVTMMLVAMFEISGPIDWHIAAYRLFATMVGGFLAVSGAFLLWPNWERSQVRRVIANGLLANHALLLQLQHELMVQTGFHARIIADRRKAEVANLAITDSVTRLQLEPGTKKQKLQAAQSLRFLNMRLTRELTSLAALLPNISTPESLPEAISVLDQYAYLLATLAESVKNKTPFTVTIPVTLPFSAVAFSVQAPPSSVSVNSQNQLHLDAEVLKSDLLHEQLNTIAASVHSLAKAVLVFNTL